MTTTSTIFTLFLEAYEEQHGLHGDKNPGAVTGAERGQLVMSKDSCFLKLKIVVQFIWIHTNTEKIQIAERDVVFKSLIIFYGMVLRVLHLNALVFDDFSGMHFFFFFFNSPVQQELHPTEQQLWCLICKGWVDCFGYLVASLHRLRS